MSDPEHAPDQSVDPTSNGTVARTGMARWEGLFADLEAELDAAADAEFAAEVADRTRREFAAVRLVDRLRAAVGVQLAVTLDVDPGLAVSGRVTDVGPDWVMLSTGAGGGRSLIPFSAVTSLRGLPTGAQAAGSEGWVEARFDLLMLLRRLVRDRAVVTLTLRSGGTLRGRLDRAGADFVDLAIQDSGERLRPVGIADQRTVPRGGLSLIRIE